MATAGTNTGTSRASPVGRLLGEAGGVRLYLGSTVALGLLAAAATVVQMVFLSKAVDRVFLDREGLASVTGLLLFMLAAAVARAGLIWAREVVAGRGAARVKAELRGRLFTHVLRLGPAYAKGERAGEISTTATEGVEKLEPYLARYLPQVALSAFVPLLVLLYVFPRDLSSAVLLLMTAPVIPVLMVLVGSYAEEHTKRQWIALSRMGAHFLDSLQGLPTLKAFGRGKDEEKRVAAISEEFREKTMKVLRYAFLSGLVLEFMTAAAIALVAVTLGVRVISGNISFEDAFLVLLLAPEFYKPLRELGVHRHAGMEGKAAAQRISEILETEPPAVRSPGEGFDASVPRESGKPGPLSERTEEGSSGSPGFQAGPTIEFRGVGYTYPGNDRPALSDLTLTLPAGTRTALVGRTGAGKSTLVNLLLRFLDPAEGEIFANGAPIATPFVEAWREKVALVPQRPYLFHGSVLENIRLARPDASRAEVEEAAELAGVAGFVGRLRGGYDVQIGDRGARLSGGEAQRLAIARAFLKDAPILVMDEPTSSLDPESEEDIKLALERLAEGRTTLIVAHRLNTVYAADRIAVLQDGRLVELGDHAALLDAGGPYARLVGAAGNGVA